MLRLGLQIPSFTYPGVPDDQLFERVSDIAVTAEQAGFAHGLLKPSDLSNLGLRTKRSPSELPEPPA